MSLPSGLFRDSFPSLLLTPTMFWILDCEPTIKYHSRLWKVLILTFTTLIAAIWFEVVIPHIFRHSKGDLHDAVAMFCGLFIYLAIDAYARHLGHTPKAGVAAKNHPETASGR